MDRNRRETRASHSPRLRNHRPKWINPLALAGAFQASQPAMRQSESSRIPLSEAHTVGKERDTLRGVEKWERGNTVALSWRVEW